MANTRKPFHEVVAEKLIEQLKAGTAPWQRPWSPGSPGGYMPINPTTGKRYKGINAIHLMAQKHTDSRWMTYKQAKAAGAQVRKGEKGTPVQYWKFSEEQNKLDDNGRPVLDEQGKSVKETITLERPRVFFATVFNAEQIDGLPVIEHKPQSWDAVERAEHILKASGATIRHGENNRAFYRPTTDSIHLPDKGRFSTADNYYATALHELGHWTGHQSRLDRDLSHPFGSEGYAKEELRAEISSMILGDALGIGHDPKQHAAYVGSWIKALEDDSLEIFRASAEAERIQEYVLAFEQKQVQMQDPIEKELGMKAATETENSDLQHHISEHERDQQAQTQGAVDELEQKRREREYINVPFKDKDEAKELGARWDRQEKSWYVPAGVDPTSFAKWAHTEATVPQKGEKTAQRRIYLAVPYADRIEAKVAGARWDKALKSWYAGPEADMEKLQRWLPENVQGQQGSAITPRKEFSEALKSLGCVLSGDHPIMDGKKHRIGVEGDKKGEQAGFYVGHLDGHPAGYIKNNRTGVDMKWKAKGYSLDPQEKAKFQAEAAEKLAARQAEHERQQEVTAQRVHRQTQNLVPVSERTLYMRTKDIHSYVGALTDAEGKKTYLPATDAAGKQWTMQYIQEDGTKRFARDGRKEGCFHALGGIEAISAAPVLVIAEGYATAATLVEALGHGTVAAFDSGNLKAVAQALHQKFPDKPVVIAGDDDRHLESTQGINPGKVKAQEAAKAVGGKAIFPVFAPGEAVYPAGFAAVTPQSYREHLRATKALEEQPGLSDEAKEKLCQSQLSDEQLDALSAMKRHTDFNDLDTRSELGREGVARQTRAAVGKAIEEYERERRQEQRQEQKQRRSARVG